MNAPQCTNEKTCTCRECTMPCAECGEYVPLGDHGTCDSCEDALTTARGYEDAVGAAWRARS